MNTFRIALAQINTTVGDFEGNTTKIIQSVKRARELKVDLVAFPELTICGYPPEDLILKTHFVKENLRQLKRIRSVTRSISAIIGLVHRQKNKDYNAAAFLHNGRIIDIYHKIHLPNYGVFDEKRYF
ncbi:MAG: NAD+ synthase, partial [Planctomycetes bacterium]|nr:NAD+ synthase [Planctomycetota bacterium]